MDGDGGCHEVEVLCTSVQCPLRSLELALALVSALESIRLFIYVHLLIHPHPPREIDDTFIHSIS